MVTKKHIYKVIFHNQGKIYELYARRVNQGNLLGFIAIEELIFGEQTSLVVDPSEDRLKAEFAGVGRIHVPMHAIIRIDELEKEGTNKIVTPDAGDNIRPFPSPIYTPPRDSG